MENLDPPNYLSTIFEHAPSGIAVFDAQMRYLAVSQQWLEMFNLTSEIIGKSHYDIFPTIPENWREYHRRGLKGEILRQEEDFHMLINGKKVWMNWEIRPWYTVEKEIGGIIILVKDITEKKIIEELRNEGERKFRAIFDQVGIGIIQTTPEGNFITVNQRFSQMTGYTLDELIQMNFADITYEDDVQISIDRKKLMLKDDIRSTEFEKRYIRKDGTIFWAHLTVTLLKNEEMPNYFISTVQDISRRRTAEEALIESEQKFKAMFDQTAMGMAQVSLDGMVINANQKCCDVLGYSLEELKTMNFTEFTHRDDVNKDVTLMDELLSGKTPTYSLEKRYIRKDGKVIWAFLTVSVVKGVDHAPKYVIAAVHDITARKTNEEELTRSRSELKKKVAERTGYLSLLQVISSEANKSDNVYEALRFSLHAICAFTGWQVGHFYMVDHTHNDKVPSTDLWCLENEEFYKPFVAKTDQLKEHDVSIIQKVVKSGKPFWSNDIFHDKRLARSDVGLSVGIKSGMAFPVLVGDEVAGVLEFFSNINIHPSPALMELMAQIGVQLGRLLERQMAKDEIELSQSRLQAIIDNLPARVYLKDRDKKYLLVNRVFKDFFNLQNVSLKGKTSSELFTQDQIDPWAKDDDKVINEGKVVTYEVTYDQHKESKKNLRSFQLTKFPVMDNKGYIYAYGGISIDVTDLKQAEVKMRELLKSEHQARTEAEKAILARDEFISIASHELKSPITALKMKVQLLLRQMNKEPGTLNEKYRTAMCKLDNDADRLVTLINRLLDITRIQTGHFELNREEVVVNELIDNLIETMGPHLENSQSSLHVEMKDKITAHWDKSRIEQVLTNLLTNAIKFGENKPIKVTLESLDHTARIIVKDQGRGIPGEFIDKIFDRYERANVKEGIQGLGLGLYIVKQILEVHGGSIKVESYPGKGSTFIVDIPLRAPTHPVPKIRPDERSSQIH